ncbi:MAG: hypothetical protein ABIP13_03070 [Tepidiformaceae bacterium]
MSEERMSFEEQLLRRAASAFVYPPTPALEGPVLAALSANVPGRAVGRGTILVRAVGATAIAAVVMAVVLVAWSGAREAVAEFLGLAVEGEQIRILPTPRPGETPAAAGPERALETYATPTTLLAARDRLQFDPQIPPSEVAPIGIHTIDYEGTAVLVLDYGRFALWEVRELTVEKGVFDKSLPPATTPPPAAGSGIFEKSVFQKGVQRLAEASVGGRPAYWISGGVHFVRFLGRDGTPVAGSERSVSRNTLVWRGAGGINYRLEIDGTLEQALAIANSLP